MASPDFQIYFAASIRGGRRDAEVYAAIAERLADEGRLLTPQIVEPEVVDAGLSDCEIHDRDLAVLADADVVVAEVTTPSLGVGYEIACALRSGKPVLALFRANAERELSAMVAGASGVEVRHYDTVEQACSLAGEFVRGRKRTGGNGFSLATPNLTTCICIGSSDSSGGAGIQADVRAMASVGVFCATVLVGYSAQTPSGVETYWPIEPSRIVGQLNSAAASFQIDAIKLGSLALPASAVRALVRITQELNVPLVVDPVIVTAAGSVLADPTRLKTLDLILPVATVVTPNIAEARIISRLADAASRDKLCEAIGQRGAQAVLVTGGEAVDGSDWLFASGQHTEISHTGPRVDGVVHGAGCTHSAILAALLARGETLVSAARVAKTLASRAAIRGRRSCLGVPVAEALSDGRSAVTTSA